MVNEGPPNKTLSSRPRCRSSGIISLSASVNTSERSMSRMPDLEPGTRWSRPRARRGYIEEQRHEGEGVYHHEFPYLCP